jgi:hypothetical protein
MTGLKPDGGPECTGIFRSRPAFDLDDGMSIPVRCLHPSGVVPFHVDPNLMPTAAFLTTSDGDRFL